MAEEYPKREVAACRMVMIEVFTILGEYRDRIALVGGGIPPLLAPENAKLHIGTLDIDLAVDTNRIGDDAYRTIRDALARHGYEQGDQPFRFFRTVPFEGGEPVKVEVDLLAGEYGGVRGPTRKAVFCEFVSIIDRSYRTMRSTEWPPKRIGAPTVWASWRTSSQNPRDRV